MNESKDISSKPKTEIETKTAAKEIKKKADKLDNQEKPNKPTVN